MGIPFFGKLESIKALYVNAPVKKVWAIHADINKWPAWHPGITEAALGGKLAPGTVFHWKSGGMTIESTIEKVVDGEEVIWNGRALGTRARHKWYFKKKGEGTIVSTEETMEGWLALILSIVMPKFLDRSIDRWLEHLKRKAERP
ncbi:MAG TPA: SRPBCC family protein [Spirochaetota bacterium]|nr:SRPBCC family protein [Spirochaetota bacterium]